MSKINLLSSKIYNRIAAGEVVERPFSVVKELVENSLDAGADIISIEIEGGGVASITITDNGSGIEKSELKKALLPHATSKISSLKDLDNIGSLGFRGEALASIASVSKILITSKPKDQEFGASIFASGGDIEEVNDCGAVDGTVIKVENLFFNTPVREKFLRSTRSEENEISATVARFILGNPNISFKYIADGKMIYQSFGDGIESAMACVYGVDVLKECFCVNVEKNGITINGYIGKHSFTKGNRSFQTAFINGRFVQNQTVSSAIMNAYSSYIMKRQYPFYVLSINLPTEIVDVNVHPNKLDVRFSNNQIIYGTLYSVVSKVLDGSSEVLNIVTESQKQQVITSDKCDDYVTHNPEVYQKITKNAYNDKVLLKDAGAKSEIKQESTKEKDTVVDIFLENKAFLESLEAKKQSLANNVEQNQIKIDRELKLVGQALNTFLILEDDIDLYLIDQHAAHERLLFDKFNNSISSGDIVTQPLLIPFVLNVSNDEFEFVLQNSIMLNNMGIEIEEFGRNSFKISSVPAFFADMNLQKFFDDILSDIDSLKDLSINDLLKEKIAQKACKAAIKSGDKLSDFELETLFGLLKDNLGLKCPHGRPIAVKITRMEIDKWFKRIV